MSGYSFEDANFCALFFGMGDIYFMSSEEKERLYSEFLSMPSYGEQAQAAKERLKDRINNRRLAKTGEYHDKANR